VFFAGLAFAGHRFMTFTRWGDEMKHIRMFLSMVVAAILELLIENFFVWYCTPSKAALAAVCICSLSLDSIPVFWEGAVLPAQVGQHSRSCSAFACFPRRLRASFWLYLLVGAEEVRLYRVVAASNKRKYDPTNMPLQDNMASFFREWMQTNSVVNWLVTWRWCSVSNMVMVFVVMCFANIWDQVLPRLGTLLLQRFLHEPLTQGAGCRYHTLASPSQAGHF
jgi:hypothetical protein